MRKLLLSFLLVLSCITFAFAASVDEVIDDNQSTYDQLVGEYVQELVALGMNEGVALSKAEADIRNLIGSMEGAKRDAQYTLEEIQDRVDAIPRNDPRRDDANDALENAEDGPLDDFNDISSIQHIEIRPSIGGVPPLALPDADFDIAEENAMKTLSNINRILLAPSKPGAVPEGDIIEDFIPQLIRQLFRFAWVAILVAFVVSGVFLVIAHDNEERVTKAKQMIYMTLIGFAFISLAFAIVKAVTDIDFFRFI